MEQSIIKSNMTDNGIISDRSLRYKDWLPESSVFANNIVGKHFIVTGTHKTHRPFIFRLFEADGETETVFKNKLRQHGVFAFKDEHEKVHSHQFDSEISAPVKPSSSVVNHESDKSVPALAQVTSLAPIPLKSFSTRQINKPKATIETGNIRPSLKILSGRGGLIQRKPLAGVITSPINRKAFSAITSTGNESPSLNVLSSRVGFIQRKPLVAMTSPLNKEAYTTITSTGLNQSVQGEFAKPADPDSVEQNALSDTFASTLSSMTMTPQMFAATRSNASRSIDFHSAVLPASTMEQPTLAGLSRPIRGEFAKPVDPDSVEQNASADTFAPTPSSMTMIPQAFVATRSNTSRSIIFPSAGQPAFAKNKPMSNSETGRSGFIQRKPLVAMTSPLNKEAYTTITSTGLNQSVQGEFAKPADPDSVEQNALSDTFASTLSSMTMTPQMFAATRSNASRSIDFHSAVLPASTMEQPTLAGLSRPIRGEFAKPVDPDSVEQNASDDTFAPIPSSMTMIPQAFVASRSDASRSIIFPSAGQAAFAKNKPISKSETGRRGFIQRKPLVNVVSSPVNQEVRTEITSTGLSRPIQGEFAKPVVPDSVKQHASADTFASTPSLKTMTQQMFVPGQSVSHRSIIFRSAGQQPASTKNKPTLNKETGHRRIIQRKPLVSPPIMQGVINSFESRSTYAKNTNDVDSWPGAQTFNNTQKQYSSMEQLSSEAGVLKEQPLTRPTELTFQQPNTNVINKIAEPILEISQLPISETQSTSQVHSPNAPAEITTASSIPTLPSIQVVADKVYQILERRLKIERERRGIL